MYLILEFGTCQSSNVTRVISNSIPDATVAVSHRYKAAIGDKIVETLPQMEITSENKTIHTHLPLPSIQSWGTFLLSTGSSNT